MDDFFALLDEPRRPWVSPDALKERFLKLSSALHPDRIHAGSEEEKLDATRQAAALNAACAALREPRTRLAHLLELETGRKPEAIQQIPSGHMNLCFEIAGVLRDIDAFLAEQSAVSSPLLRARLFEQGLAWTDRLLALQQKVNAVNEELALELQSLNSFWECAPPEGSPERLHALPIDRLDRLYRLISYASRWTEQIQERIVQLSLAQ